MTKRDEETVLVCARVADMETPPVKSLMNICDLCGWRVWASLKAPTVDHIWCQRCAEGRIDDDETVYAAKEGDMVKDKEIPGLDKRMQKVTVSQRVYYEVWVEAETLAGAIQIVSHMIGTGEQLDLFETTGSDPFEVVSPAAGG